jgi:hypothetical protein
MTFRLVRLKDLGLDLLGEIVYITLDSPKFISRWIAKWAGLQESTTVIEKFRALYTELSRRLLDQWA